MNNVDNQNSNVSINLTSNETNIVVAALRELPHRVVAELVNKIMEQVKNQIPNAYNTPTIIQN